MIASPHVANVVGVSRFERPTTRTPSEYATRLRHTPICSLISLGGSKGQGPDGFSGPLFPVMQRRNHESSAANFADDEGRVCQPTRVVVIVGVSGLRSLVRSTGYWTVIAQSVGRRVFCTGSSSLSSFDCCLLRTLSACMNFIPRRPSIIFALCVGSPRTIFRVHTPI